MAKIIKGGLVGQDQQMQDEPGYLMRNIQQYPYRLQQMAQSGFGLGDILEALRNEFPNASESLGSIIDPQALEQIRNIPTMAQVGERIGAPAQRPEDYPFEFLSLDLPLALATGGAGAIKSLPALGRTLLGSGARMAGHYLGSTAGEALGDYFDIPQTGAIAGGAAGIYGGQRAAQYGRSMLPSSQQGAMEAADAAALQEKVQKLQESGTPEAYNMQQALLDEELGKSRSAEDFQNVKNQKMKLAEQQKIDYENRIKTLSDQASESYQLAEELAGDTTGNAQPFEKTLDSLYDDINKAAISVADKNLLKGQIGDIKKTIQEGKLSLKDAKDRVKDINSTRFERGVSERYRNYAGKIVGELNNYIEEIGSPEHTEAWRESNALTTESKNLEKTFPEIEGAIKEDVRDIKGQKYTPENKAVSFFNNAMGYFDKKGTGGIVGFALSQLFGGNKAFSALAGELINAAGREGRTAMKMMRDNPKIWKQYKAIVKEAASPKGMDMARFVQSINALSPDENERPVFRHPKILKGGFI